ncbi:hypothetical protein JCM10207_005890 [Rhodosporidiobolus poonsookiae]
MDVRTHTSHTPRTRRLSPLESLPTHLLLTILRHLPLHDLAFALKPSSRTLNLAAVAVAREWALPLWLSEVEAAARARGAPHTASSSPLSEASAFDAGGDTLPTYTTPQPPAQAQPPGPLSPRSRELAILDLFVVSLARTSRLLAMSSLFSAENDSSALSASWATQLGGGGVRDDLFGLLQPRARTEDLAIAEGRRQGLVERDAAGRNGPGQPGGVPADPRCVVRALDVRIELKPRTAAFLLPFPSSSGRVGSAVWKPVVEVSRRPAADSPETVARWLIDELVWVRLRRRDDGRGGAVYERV